MFAESNFEGFLQSGQLLLVKQALSRLTFQWGVNFPSLFCIEDREIV